MGIIINIRRPLQIGSMYLTTPIITNCLTKDTYYKIEGLAGYFCDGASRGFTVSETGTITFLGVNNTKANANGVSDVEANKQCRLTYALFKKGILVPTAETPSDITNVNKSRCISITRGLTLQTDDYFDVYVKASVDDVDIKSNTLMLTFNCDR